MKNKRNGFIYTLFSLSILLLIQFFFATRESSFFTPLESLLPNVFPILLFIIFLTSFFWDIPFSLHHSMKVQKLYKAPSWVFYFSVLLFLDTAAIIVAIIYKADISMPHLGFAAHILARLQCTDCEMVVGNVTFLVAVLFGITFSKYPYRLPIHTGEFEETPKVCTRCSWQ